MPYIDLGQVVGPQGATGATGPRGPQGVQGNPGPNQVTASTSTTLSGVLKGVGGSVTTVPVDSAPNSEHTDRLISSAAVAVALGKEAILLSIPAIGNTVSQVRIPSSGSDDTITKELCPVWQKLSNPMAQTGPWEIDTRDGFLVVKTNGNINTASTAYYAVLAKIGTYNANGTITEIAADTTI